MKKTFKSLLKSSLNFHRPNGEPDFFIFTLPRSGSTWLMELLVTQPSFKYCHDLFDIRNPLVCKNMGINSWNELYTSNNAETIKMYVNKIQSGKLGFLNPSPFGEYYRPFTKRIVFKCLNFGKDRINWFKDTFGSKVVFLVRHPLAVATSRKQLPILNTLVQSTYMDKFTSQQRDLSEHILKSGNHYEKAVLSWCLHNGSALNDRKEDWGFVTYEQLVVDPKNVIHHLTSKLDLVKTNIIEKNLAKQSMVKNMSDQKTKEIFQAGEGERNKLISKWRQKIDAQKEALLFKILDDFEIDLYTFGNDMASEKYLIKK